MQAKADRYNEAFAKLIDAASGADGLGSNPDGLWRVVLGVPEFIRQAVETTLERLAKPDFPLKMRRRAMDAILDVILVSARR